MKLKVLIVDDTIFYRKIIKDILATFPDVEVVGSVANGQIALSRVKTLQPDLLTLDVEMPIMNGLQVLEELKKQNLDIGCIMVSSKTQEGSEATIQALELGAFDFIEKPTEERIEDNIAQLKKSLTATIKAFVQRQSIRRKISERRQTREPAVTRVQPEAAPVDKAATIKTGTTRTIKSNAIAIGVSTGGPNALTQLLPKLPGNINVPIFLVQHMPPVFSASLAKSLDKKCQLRVKEAQDGEPVESNTVYIAEGGKHMKIVSGANSRKTIKITDDPPENNCKPAVDYLLRSVAREYGSRATCVIMTGMGSDGKLGIAVAKATGALTIAQDETSCVVYGMPKAVIDAGLADIIAPLEMLAEEILKTV